MQLYELYRIAIFFHLTFVWLVNMRVCMCVFLSLDDSRKWTNCTCYNYKCKIKKYTKFWKQNKINYLTATHSLTGYRETFWDKTRTWNLPKTVSTHNNFILKMNGNTDCAFQLFRWLILLLYWVIIIKRKCLCCTDRRIRVSITHFNFM